MLNMKVIGSGFYVPEQVVTNDDLAKLMDTNDEWIVQRTGVKTRRYAPEGMSGVDMIERAAQQALDEAKIDKSQIEAVISATLSPDHTFPGQAPFNPDRLGLNGCAVLDVRNQCTGSCIQWRSRTLGSRRHVQDQFLITGSEIHSTALDFTDAGRDVTVLFG